MHLVRYIATALATVFFAGSGFAFAGSPNPTTPPVDEGLVEELVVTARYPGPAFWRVSDADSEIWILAVPSPTPNGLIWDKRQLEKVMKGANGVVLPSVVTVGLMDGMKFVISKRKQFNNPNGKTLAEVLPQSSIDQYLKIDPAFRKANDLKSKLKPVLFAFQSRMSIYDKKRWSEFYIDNDVVTLARKYKVKIRRASVQPGLPIAEGIIGLNTAEQIGCFDTIIEGARDSLRNTDDAAKAWADGDTALMLSLTSGASLTACALNSSQGQSAESKVYADVLNVVKQALAQPGKTLLVVSNARGLVEKRGILAQLRDQGLTVRSPAE